MSAEQYDDREHLLASLRKQVVTDRKQPMHGRLKHTLFGELLGNELEPTLDAEFADIACKTGRGLALYVVSGSEAGTYTEIRNEAVRVLEIEWAGGERADDLFLVLAREPQDLWAVELVDEAFKVSVIWKTPAGWDGPGIDIALGRSSEEE